MKRTFQRTDTCSYRAVCVGTCWWCYTYCEGWVVTSSVFSLNDKQKIKHTCIKFCVFLMLQHIEEILCYREVFSWVTNMQTSSLYGVTIDVICVGNNRWELSNKFYWLTHKIVSAYIIRIRIKGVHLQNTTTENVHDVRTLKVDDVHDSTVVKRHIIVDKLTESSKFLLIRQLTRKDKICYFLKAESLFLQQRSNKVIKLIPTIKQLTRAWHERTTVVTLITNNITYIGESYKHTRTIFITKSSFNTIFRKRFLRYLTRVLYFVTKLVY